MNELQKKLMRRRNLNGELNASVTDKATGESSVGDDLSPPQVLKKEPQRPLSQDHNTSRSSSNELFNKLARRRDLNGEIPNANNESSHVIAVESSTMNNTTCTDQIPDVSSLKNDQNVDKTSSRTVSAEKPLSDNAPAWLNDLIESTATEDMLTANETTLQNNNETNQTIEQNKTSEFNFLSVVAVPVVLSETTPVLSSTQDAVVVATNPLVAINENPIPVPTVISSDSEQLEAHNSLVTEHTVPELMHEETISTEEVQEADNMKAATDACLHAQDSGAQLQSSASISSDACLHAHDSGAQLQSSASVSTDACLHAQDSGAQLQSSASISCDETMLVRHLPDIDPASPHVEEDILEQAHQQSCPPAAPVAAAGAPSVDQTTLDSTAPAPMTIDTPDNSKSLYESIQSSSSGISPRELPPLVSPPNSRSSWSPLRFTNSSSSSVNPLSRANTSTGAAGFGSGNANNDSISPLRRTNSLSGSHTVPTKKSSWYPGKYILEGSTGWSNGSSKSSTPRLKMNSDAARSHYAEMLSSSAKEYPEEHLAALTSTGTGATSLGNAIRVPSIDLGTPRSSVSLSQQQREEEIKAAQIPETAVRGTSDDIIDIVLQLSRENSQLKKEVSFLREELTRQLHIVGSLQPKGEHVELVPAGNCNSNKNGDANNRVQTHMEESKVATRPGLQKSRSSSRRFGARGYYSNYSKSTTHTLHPDNTGDDEEEENLFDPEDECAEGGETAKRPVYHTSDFAMEDLVSTPTEKAPTLASMDIQTLPIDQTNANTNSATAMNESSQQNLDLLLNSVSSNSASKEKQRLSVRAEKYLVQSFMSTSMIPSQEEQEEQPLHPHSSTGVWKEKFGSLGLLSETQEGNDALFGEERESLIALESAAAEAAKETMDYQEFLSKFTKTHDLVNMTRDFIFSILGPNGDATQPIGRKKLNYVFYGVHKLDLRCRHFFDDTSSLFLDWAEFRNENEERLLCARDGIEQYVMTRIAEYAFKTVLDSEGDDILLRRMKLLSFLKPEALDIKPEMFNETLLAIAAEELRKINSFKTPGDKVACVVKSVTLIFRSLSLCKATTTALAARPTAALAGAEEESSVSFAGADDFMPLFIWVVLRSHIPKLASNVSYIQAYLNPARLMGKWGYCLINLCSAIEFVKYAEPDQFLIDPKEYDMKLAQAERELNGGF